VTQRGPGEDIGGPPAVEVERTVGGDCCLAGSGEGDKLVWGDVADLAAVEGLREDCNPPEEGADAGWQRQHAEAPGSEERIGQPGGEVSSCGQPL
jgi:hypothetical protein